MAMGSFHGKLYVGTLPFAKVYRCDGDHHWTEVGHLDKTPDVPIRRAWTGVEHEGGWLVTTLPSGEVFRLDSGVGVTDPNALSSGGHQIAAIRNKDKLSLYVDGVCVASRRDARLPSMSIASGATFRVGQGAYSPFRGKIASVRVESRALHPEELAR
jgi:hypothetical protein